MLNMLNIKPGTEKLPDTRRKEDRGFSATFPWKHLAYYQRYEPFATLLSGAYEGSEDLIRRGKAELRTLLADRQ